MDEHNQFCSCSACWETRIVTMPISCATVYVFGVKRPKDSEPWYLAFKSQGLAEAYQHRCTAVTAVLLYEREDTTAHSAGSAQQEKP